MFQCGASCLHLDCILGLAKPRWWRQEAPPKHNYLAVDKASFPRMLWSLFLIIFFFAPFHMQPRINRNLKLVELSLCHCIFFYLY